MRRAVEKTVQSTLGTAGASRGRAQELADDVLRRASVGDRLREAIQELRTIGTAGEDIKELRAEVRALRRKVEQLEGDLQKRAAETRAKPKKQKKNSGKKSNKS